MVKYRALPTPTALARYATGIEQDYPTRENSVSSNCLCTERYLHNMEGGGRTVRNV